MYVYVCLFMYAYSHAHIHLHAYITHWLKLFGCFVCWGGPLFRQEHTLRVKENQRLSRRCVSAAVAGKYFGADALSKTRTYFHLQMYVPKHVHTQSHTHPFRHPHIYIYIYMYMHIYKYIYICICMYVCLRLRLHVFSSV